MDHQSVDVDHLRRALDGDARSWNHLVDTYAGLVWSVVRTYRMDHASQEDAYQATWLRLLDKGDTINDPGRLSSWLVTVAKRECLALLRSSSRTLPASDAIDSMLPAPGLGSTIEQVEIHSGVRSGFDQLDERCRLLLSMLVADPPVPYVAIGESLGLAVGSIGPTRQRCLDKLRELLETARIIEPRSRSNEREARR